MGLCSRWRQSQASKKGTRRCPTTIESRPGQLAKHQGPRHLWTLATAKPSSTGRLSNGTPSTAWDSDWDRGWTWAVCRAKPEGATPSTPALDGQDATRSRTPGTQERGRVVLDIDARGARAPATATARSTTTTCGEQGSLHRSRPRCRCNERVLTTVLHRSHDFPCQALISHVPPLCPV